MGAGELSGNFSFGFLKASKLFNCFYEGLPWPEEVEIEDITDQFQ